MAKVIGLYIYPIKSCGSVPLQKLSIDEYGPVWDRNWMLVDQSGKFITQRECPQLSQVKIKVLSIESGEFELSFTGKSPINLSPSNADDTLSVKVWEWDLQALKCSDDLNKWFSDIVGNEVFLVESSKTKTQRKVKEKYGDSYFKFADGLPVLLIGSGSIDLLNEKLESPITISNFRTNIYVETKEAHIEDSWKSLSINNLNFDLVKRCSRCKMININQDTGEQNPKVLKTLASYRRSQKGLEFGQNLVHKGVGIINVGDEITVQENF